MSYLTDGLERNDKKSEPEKKGPKGFEKRRARPGHPPRNRDIDFGIFGADIYQRVTRNFQNARHSKSARNFGFYTRETRTVDDYASGERTAAVEKDWVGAKSGKIFTTDENDQVILKHKYRTKDWSGGAYTSATSSDYDDLGNLKKKSSFHKYNILGGLSRVEHGSLSQADTDGKLFKMGHKTRATLGWGMLRVENEKNGNVSRAGMSSSVLGATLYRMGSSRVTTNADGGYVKESNHKFLDLKVASLFKAESTTSKQESDSKDQIKTSKLSLGTIKMFGKDRSLFQLAITDDSRVKGKSFSLKILGIRLGSGFGSEDGDAVRQSQEQQRDRAIELFKETKDIYGRDMRPASDTSKPMGIGLVHQVEHLFNQNVQTVLGDAERRTKPQLATVVP